MEAGWKWKCCDRMTKGASGASGWQLKIQRGSPCCSGNQHWDNYNCKQPGKTSCLHARRLVPNWICSINQSRVYNVPDVSKWFKVIYQEMCCCFRQTADMFYTEDCTDEDEARAVAVQGIAAATQVALQNLAEEKSICVIWICISWLPLPTNPNYQLCDSPCITRSTGGTEACGYRQHYYCKTETYPSTTTTTTERLQTTCHTMFLQHVLRQRNMI